jgi:hypothetical protein
MSRGAFETDLPGPSVPADPWDDDGDDGGEPPGRGAVGRAPRGPAARHAWAAPLRDAPRWERVLRGLLALGVVGYLAVGAWLALAQPREIRDTFVTASNAYVRLLADVNAGRVDVIEDDGVGRVYWRNHDGAAFWVDKEPSYDLVRSVEAQPYVRDHPGAVRYGHVPRPHEPLWRGGVAFFGVVGFLMVLVGAPEPRLTTRWGWVWIAATGVGLVAYLLFAGSWSRIGDPPRRGKPGGLAMYVAMAGLVVAGHRAAHGVYDLAHPVRPTTEYVPAVASTPLA